MIDPPVKLGAEFLYKRQHTKTAHEIFLCDLVRIEAKSTSETIRKNLYSSVADKKRDDTKVEKNFKLKVDEAVAFIKPRGLREMGKVLVVVYQPNCCF